MEWGRVVGPVYSVETVTMTVLISPWDARNKQLVYSGGSFTGLNYNRIVLSSVLFFSAGTL